MPKVNTLYVDKNLKQHGLIQAFSRANRIREEVTKEHLSLETSKKNRWEPLFSNKEAIEVVTMPAYEAI
jgi:type I restriction enzyme R subunit